MIDKRLELIDAFATELGVGFSTDEDISFIMKLADKYLNNAEELAKNIGLL